jgi:hypothetical protein
LRDLKWWAATLTNPGTFRLLRPRGPLLDLEIFVDANTDWGIGIILDGQWAAFHLTHNWKSPGRDICWLETLAIEFLAYIFEKLNIRERHILIRSDNQGTIGSMEKGRSRNIHINLAIRRTYAIFANLFITPVIEYVPSADNLADPISRGEVGHLDPNQLIHISLPEELTPIFCHAFSVAL